MRAIAAITLQTAAPAKIRGRAMKGAQEKGAEARAISSAKPILSSWAPFRHPIFTLLWTTAVVANIGTWMYNAASGWLMTSLDPDPLIVSLVQAASSLPMFLFALPAGALADILDRRGFLIVGESAITAVSALFAALVWLGLAT